jgi:hypothetical protein
MTIIHVTVTRILKIAAGLPRKICNNRLNDSQQVVGEGIARPDQRREFRCDTVENGVRHITLIVVSIQFDHLARIAFV